MHTALILGSIVIGVSLFLACVVTGVAIYVFKKITQGWL